jgi:hypothetical protein
MSVRYQLSCLAPADTKAEAIDDVVDPALKELKEIMACLSRKFRCLFIYRAELGLVESVETAKLLLFPQTEAIFAHFAAAGTMLTRP